LRTLEVNNNRGGDIISGNDYIKYITQQVTTYIDLPSDKRKERKAEQKHQRPSYSNRWLGVVPFMLRSFLKNAK